MTDKKQAEENGGINPIVAAVTGVAIGAGIAAAGVVAFKDKKNREKIKDMLTNAKDQTNEYISNMQKTEKKKTAKVKDKLTDDKTKIKKVLANSA